MTARQPPDTPEFATVMRGYDKAQVDDYVSKINEWLGEMTERARTAEARATTEAEHRERLQSQVAELEHRASTGGRRDGADLDRARREAQRIVAEAERSAAALRQQAVRDIDQLRSTRDVLLRDLERLGRPAADAG
jgi:cell division septum initiation protein DivIVA